MTAKELFEGYLIETVKEESPQYHLREFNFKLNRVINEFVRNIVVSFEQNQMSLDYLKALKRTQEFTTFLPGLKGGVKYTLPSDYRHLTNCIVFWNITAPIIDECYEVGNVINFKSNRLDSDTQAAITRDHWLRPRYFRPFHQMSDNEVEILSGIHPGVEMAKVVMDYIKTPEKITLTNTQAFQDTIDTSQVLEFDEIAAITNLKVEHIRVLLSRARKFVTMHLEEIYNYEQGTGR